MRTDDVHPLGVAAAVALVTACSVHVAPNVVAAVLAAAAVVLLTWLVKQQWDVESVRRRSRRRRVLGTTVHVVDGAVACTAGPLAPKIFLGTHVLASLDHDELQAVILHERAHRLRLDPLWAALVGIVRALTPTSLVRPDVASHVEAHREIRADRAALRGGATRRALAASLLKVPASPVGVVGFASVSELRVRALLDDDRCPRPRRHWPLVVAGLTAGAAFCLMGLESMLFSNVLACCV